MPNKMKKLRHAIHFTQAEVANILKIPVSTYQQYETEKRACPPDMLIKIADFYHVSIDELLLRTPSDQSRYIKVSADEQSFLSAYRASDAHDKRIVKMILHKSGQSDTPKDPPPKKFFQDPMRFANRGAEATDSEAPTPEQLENLEDLPDVPDET